MDDLISRQAAIEEVEMLLEQSEDDALDTTWNNAIRGAISAVKHHVPSAQPEQKRGKWIESTELSEQVKGKKYCSNCGKAQCAIEITDKTIQIKSVTSKFCPECGAKMEASHES